MSKKIVLVFLGVFVWCTFLYFAVSLSPQKFVKLASLRASSDMFEHLNLSLDNTLDPRSIISSIPYERGRFVDVLPARRYQRSIIEGKGDCSNLVNGLAYRLIEDKIEFAIVHQLRMPGFTEGEGHVALEVALDIDGTRQSAILDLLEGGVLSDGNRIISSNDLQTGEHEKIKVVSYHPTRDDRSAYYERKNLNNTLLGFTPDEEIGIYYDFVDSVYLNLGHRTIERYLYDGVALLIGSFPKIYVSSDDLVAIDREYGESRFGSILLLWIVRLFVIASTLFFSFHILRRFSGVKGTPS